MMDDWNMEDMMTDSNVIAECDGCAVRQVTIGGYEWHAVDIGRSKSIYFDRMEWESLITLIGDVIGAQSEAGEYIKMKRTNKDASESRGRSL